jgi:cytochrome c oxidase assembly protein subunit 15
MGMGRGGAGADERPLGVWLLCVAALVFAMVLLGGATRLTNSGLSMVEWKPLMGVLPPLSDEAWQQTFDKYKQFPEYQKVNRGMELAEFKRIFYFEYGHRVLGRLIGLSFALPFLWFLLRRRIAWRRVPVLAGLFVLGGMQGLVGWWMVKSGLIDHPDVSHYRLTVHLGLAVAIFAALLWVGLGFLYGDRPLPHGRRRDGVAKAVAALLALVYLQILSGGMVAGFDAGFVYNTFPKMNEYWLPPELGQLTPAWHNLFENAVTIQFDHRIGAYLVALSVIAVWAVARRGHLGHGSAVGLNLVLAAMALQFALGVATLLSVVDPVLGVLHQGGALLLTAALVFTLHRLHREPA